MKDKKPKAVQPLKSRFRKISVTSRDCFAGCFNCNGKMKIWDGPNSQAVAAHHTIRTGHETWAEVTMSILYKGELIVGLPGERGGAKKI